MQKHSVIFATNVSLRKQVLVYFVCFLLLIGILAPATTLRAGLEQIMEAGRTLYGARGVYVVRAWEGLIAQASGLSEQGKVAAVNVFFNRQIVYVSDIQAWGQTDYWATPLEALAVGRGDCEDYSIAKYVTLRMLGIDDSRLRITYVKASMVGGGGAVAHMVLGYYPSVGGEPLILDNLMSDIRPASRRPDLFPVFSFNADGVWTGAQSQQAGRASDRISKWRDLLAKMRQEGIEVN